MKKLVSCFAALPVEDLFRASALQTVAKVNVVTFPWGLFDRLSAKSEEDVGIQPNTMCHLNRV